MRQCCSIAACILSSVAWATVFADPVDDFRNLADNRLAVRQSFGVRHARAISARQVEVVIGMSVTRSAGIPAGWRVISYQDGNYAYEKFIKPLKATVRREPEADGPAGCAFARFERTIVTLELREEMKRGTEYFVVGQGVNGEMVTGAHTAAGFIFGGGPGAGDATNDTAVDLAVLGLRQVEPVGPGLLKLEFGPDFSGEAAAQFSNYTVVSAGKPLTVTGFGRLSRLDTYLPTGWPFVAIPMHEVFLQLDRPLRDGETIEVNVAPAITRAADHATLHFDEKTSLSNSIKVNQVGYLADSPIKVAYLGRWMGSFSQGQANASSALSFPRPPEFRVCSEQDGSVAFTGQTALVHKSGEMDEGHYKVDHSGENVYVMEFTALKKPGRYFISVPQVGRSLSFTIGDDVYKTAFEVQSYGVFSQRCGIELAPPYSPWHRIACHNQGVVLTSQVRGEPHDIKDLSSKVVKQGDVPQVIMASGGHHDAGDYNPRSHLDVAQTLMDAYEMMPRKFYDGQLNIPEAGNGIPDILDEAFWALKLWIGLQENDGGVHNGTESAGDPNFVETVELDHVGDYAYAKDAAGSYAFAGAMAQASRLWRAVGRTQDADDFLARARKAYIWADSHPPVTTTARERASQYADPKAYAAAQLLKTTGDARYNRDFLQVCVWTAKPDADIESYQQYDQSLAGWTYATCDPQVADPGIQAAIRQAIIGRADTFIASSRTMAYAFIRHPQAPINWGTGAYENNLPPVIWAWRLTGDDKYRYWIVRTCDNTLGANPLNRSYVVGLGARTVRAPLHNSRYGHLGEVVSGSQVEGPVQSGNGYRVKEVAYPAIRENFASLYTFVDAHFAIDMDEQVVPAQAKSMAAFGLLLPDRN